MIDKSKTKKGILKIAFVAIVVCGLLSCKEEEKEKTKHPAEPEMVAVAGGTFTMGCTDGNCHPDGREEPAHQVTLNGFKMAKYPVTQKQWELIMGRTIAEQAAVAGFPNNPNALVGVGDNYPVYWVNWDDVQEFIQKLNVATGKKYRLPTEAEWEYAARGGNKSKGCIYSGGNDPDAVAWHSGNSDSKAHPVGTKAANELGIYDMSGNLWEWCKDWYSAYSSDPQSNPQGAATGTVRVVRGGTWFNSAPYCRVATRHNTTPDNSNSNYGFRLALSE